MKKILTVAVVACVAAGAAFAVSEGKVPTDFFPGHTHNETGHAVDAPQHSGGLDRSGCHNGSVSYHCH